VNSSGGAVETDYRSRLRAGLSRGETLLGSFLTMGSSISAEVASQVGFDWLMIDLEHGASSEANVVHELRAIELGAAAGLVRVEGKAAARIGRVLDLGAQGVVVPRVDTSEEARLLVDAAVYPPAGSRGLSVSGRTYGFGRDSARVRDREDERPFVVVQIESGSGIENAQSIAAIPGVDVLFVGPNDLSLALGIYGQFDHASFDHAIKAVGQAALSEGKAAGVVVWPGASVPHLVEQGFRFLCVASDVRLLRGGAKNRLEQIRREVAIG